MSVSAEGTSPARGLRILLVRKGAALFNGAKAVAWTHQSGATEVTIFNGLEDSFIILKHFVKKFLTASLCLREFPEIQSFARRICEPRSFP